MRVRKRFGEIVIEKNVSINNVLERFNLDWLLIIVARFFESTVEEKRESRENENNLIISR